MKLKKVKARHYTGTASDGTNYRIVRPRSYWGIEFETKDGWLSFNEVAGEYGLPSYFNWARFATKRRAAEHLQAFVLTLESDKIAGPERKMQLKRDREQRILELAVTHLRNNQYRPKEGGYGEWSIRVTEWGDAAHVSVSVPDAAIRDWEYMYEFFQEDAVSD